MGTLGGCRQSCSYFVGEGKEECGAGCEAIVYAPGGVMSVATASALNVKWPDVCQEGIVSSWAFSIRVNQQRKGRL